MQSPESIESIRDLVEDLVAGSPEPLVGLPTLDANVEDIARLCRRRRRRAVALLGPDLSGASFSMEQLAARIRTGTAPEELRGVSVLKVRLAPILSEQAGQPARTLARLGEAVGKLSRAILFFDDLQALVKSGSEKRQEEVVTAFQELVTSPGLAKVTFVAATRARGFDLFVRNHTVFEQFFTSLRIQWPQQAVEMEAVRLQLRQLFPEAVAASDQLVEKSLRLARIAFPDRFAVDGALDLLDGARVRCVDPSDEAAFLAALDDESLHQLTQGAPFARNPDAGARFQARLERHIVGQPTVVRNLVRAFEQGLLGFGADRGPRTVILLAGPSGVGKTHSARTYAEALGAGELVHLHLGDYASRETALAALLGTIAGPGAAASPRPLVEPVRDRPATVILFDEIDQAPAEVQEMLARILDEGNIHDGYGNSISFREPTIFLETNVGEFDEPVHAAGFAVFDDSEADQTRREVLQRLAAHLPASVLSRVPVSVAFAPLSLAQMAEIAEYRIRDQAELLRERTGLALEVGPGVGEVIVRWAGDLANGDARALEKILRQEIWPRLSEELFKKREDWPRLHTLRLEADLSSIPNDEDLQRPLHVLLLDDQPEQELLRLNAGLSDTDKKAFPVTASSVLSEAFHPEASWDAVLLDLNWGTGPGDGLAMLRQLRAEAKDLPVFIYTGAADHGDRPDFYAAGAAAFINKDDHKTLRRVLDRARREVLLQGLAVFKNPETSWVSEVNGQTLVIALSPWEALGLG